ncbi:MAG: N-acetylmuramoyl-L-alanine amidase [Candidatus Kuenenia sp.]|nr:N-acetylmuramoyl-L-alanine amidase [Candidatus Kuenenia hertensis]
MTVYFMLPAYKPTITAEQLKKGLASVSRQLDCYSVRKWEYIVIHHSGTKSGNAGEFDKFHREKRRWKNGLGYHFVIGNGDGAGNGLVEIGDRWVNQQSGAHVGINKYNRYGIGICMVGNFNESYPTRAQMASLFVLTQYLQARCNISSKNIILHSDCKNTDCPGANFPYDKLFAQALP